MSWPAGSRAIFENGRAPTATVEPGAVLGKWIVRLISSDGVTVTDGTETLVLNPAFSTAAVDLAPQPPSPRPQRPKDAWGRHMAQVTYLERPR